ncbi:MAG: hypothetical protein AB7G15_00390 [Alphaproteobacteria bacterium]
MRNEAPDGIRFDVASKRAAYLKGAQSAAGAIAVLVALSLLFGVPPIDASFTTDQIIWLVAICILLFSLRDFAIALATLAIGPALLFRFQVDGVRIGGAETPALPWTRIVAIDVRRGDDGEVLEIVVRAPAPPIDWKLAHVYGLQAIRRGDMVVFNVRCDRIGLTEAALRDGLRPFVDHLPAPAR